MITEQDLKEAIAECNGQRHPNANVCLKLAAFYVIKDHLFPEAEELARTNMNTNEYKSDSEFMKIAQGVDFGKILEVFDELMETLMVINPRLYESVVRKLTQ